MLENILKILDVYGYVLFDNQDPELQFLSLMGCINGTRFEKYIVYKMETKWKNVMLTVAYTLYKNKEYFVVDVAMYNLPIVMLYNYPFLL